MSAALIGMRCRHVNVIPVKVDIKTIDRLVTSTLRDLVDVAPVRANENINSLNRHNYLIKLYIVGYTLQNSN